MLLQKVLKKCWEQFTCFFWMSGLQNPLVQKDFNMILDDWARVKILAESVFTSESVLTTVRGISYIVDANTIDDTKNVHFVK